MNIIVAGDYAPCGRLSPIIENRDYGFLSEVKPIIASSDYSIVNLECPVSDSNASRINKLGPHLCCHENGVEALKWAGFKCITLANNHFYDYGDEGVKNTIMACIKNELDYVGGGSSYAEASRVLYKEIDGRVLAIINCCEHEFSLSTSNNGGANPLNPIKVYYDIQTSKERADYTIVIVHGGHEHFQLPSLRMVELYRYFVDIGADAVINHHQHCYSGYEVYNNKPIYYGLGNFCFDGKWIKCSQQWNYGYMVRLELEDGVISSSLIPYSQCLDNQLKVKLITDGSLQNSIDHLSSLIKNPALLKRHVEEYYDNSTHDLKVVLSPINNRYLRAAQFRHLLPIILSDKYLLRLEDFFLCESHRDKMEYFFKRRKKRR